MLKCALLSGNAHFKAVIPLLWPLQGNFIKYSSLAYDFYVHQAFYFLIGGSTCNSFFTAPLMRSHCLGDSTLYCQELTGELEQSPVIHSSVSKLYVRSLEEAPKF
jgi:hypothetical protein